MSIPIRTLLSNITKTHQNLTKTKQLHAIIAKTHLSLDPFFATKITRYYARNGHLSSAHQLFDETPHRSIYLWNSIIRAHAQAYDFKTTFDLFKQLLKSDISPDNFTFACILRACCDNNDVHGLRVVHGGLLVFGLGHDPICVSALVSGYSKMGFVYNASKVFGNVDDHDLATYNSMVSGYGGCGMWDKGLSLFSDMRHRGVEPDGYSLVALLSGFVEPGLLGVGQGVHGFCVKSGLLSNAHVGSSLVAMYSRCGCLELAYGVFCSLEQPDLVTWSALITGFARSGDNISALLMFRERNMEGMKGDPVLLASILAASAQLANVKPGLEIHGFILRHGFEMEIMVSSALIDMYSKCGFLELAMRVLNNFPSRNVVTYNAAILGLGSHGNAVQAFKLFDELLERGLRPDESTFSALLQACCQSGLVKEGKEFFDRMKVEFDIEPRNEHYVYLVKILAMSGKLEEAFSFILTLSEPVDAGIWGALLACCEMHGNSTLVETVLRHIVENQQQAHPYSVQLSNIYANHERWEDVEKLRDDSVHKKAPGLSWIGV